MNKLTTPPSKIPKLYSISKPCVVMWLEAMADLGLLYHLDDDPADIIDVRTGAHVFTAEEAEEVFKIAKWIHRAYQGDVFTLMLDIVQSPKVNRFKTVYAVMPDGLPRSPWARPRE